MSFWAAARTFKAECFSACPVNVPVSWLNMIDKDTFRVPGTADALCVCVTGKNKNKNKNKTTKPRIYKIVDTV